MCKHGLRSHEPYTEVTRSSSSGSALQKQIGRFVFEVSPAKRPLAKNVWKETSGGKSSGAEVTMYEESEESHLWRIESPDADWEEFEVFTLEEFP